MFWPNETLEISLWKSASCRRMRDVFGLQWQLLQTVFVQKAENTRPEGFKTYFITPPGYLSSCSLKRPLNHQSVHTLRSRLDAAGPSTKPPLCLSVQTNTKALPLE